MTWDLVVGVSVSYEDGFVILSKYCSMDLSFSTFICQSGRCRLQLFTHPSPDPGYLDATSGLGGPQKIRSERKCSLDTVFVRRGGGGGGGYIYCPNLLGKGMVNG